MVRQERRRTEDVEETLFETRQPQLAKLTRTRAARRAIRKRCAYRARNLDILGDL